MSAEPSNVVRMTGANYYEQQSRDKKCRAMCRWFLDSLVEVLETATDEMWQNSALKAGVNTPKQESRDLIIEMLKKHNGQFNG